ncbi:1,2-phenylacetyl-CoA epoxidase subunit PaaD [Streptomyces sp. WMMC905]|uniref:1,2-phenylacetyl-CoA epoxidase subunit PaaD n=2 Tax=unclassified Streptomyces TaxID=2593676 RepID=UPI003B95A773
MTPLEAELLEIAGSVPDPEMPVLSLRELGVLRSLRAHGPESVEVELTPTYTGCPAIEAMAQDIREALGRRGVRDVEVRTVLTPAWSTDDITPEGRSKLRRFGIAPPRPSEAHGPVSLRLGATRRGAVGPSYAEPPETAGREAPVHCPLCGSPDTELLSRFSSTACKALRRCRGCREPFDHFKEL